MVLIYIWCFIPHIFLWGSCFWFCIPSASSSCSARALSHTHNFVTRTHGWSPVTPQHFEWQVWHLVTSTFLCVAGVALGDINLRFCGAGVGLGDIDVAFAWQGGTCGTLSHTQLCHAQLCPSFGVAGVAPALTLSHTHNSFIHTNFNTQLFHMQICHAHISFTHKLEHTHTSTHNSSTHNLLHTILSHTAVHTKLFYTQLLHTLPFTRDSFTHNIVTHTQPFLVTHTHHSFTHSSITYSSFTQPVFRHLISFPIQFSHLFWACWKKLACGVIRSFNYNGQNPLVIQRSELETHHI